MGSQQFCLKWNNHQMNLLAVFDQLLQNEAFVDVTLACEGVSLKAHKMVLSACSPYFQTLFLDNPCKHPIVILNSMRYIDLKAIIDFMYKGEVNVSQDQLSMLLKTAEMLKVKGLAEVTNQTKQNIVASGVMPPLSASPPLPHVGQRSPPHIRTSLSPPPKRKKLRTSAMSSAASSPQTPTMSSSVPVSSATDSTPQTLEPKIVSQTSLADLSQDGHSDADGLSRHSEQNSDSVPDLRLEPTLEIKEDNSPTTSNMASDMSYDTLPPDLGNADHPGMDVSNLSAGPSTSGTQSQSSDHANQFLIPVIPVKCELSPEVMVTDEEVERFQKSVKQSATEIAWSTQDCSMLGYPTAAPPWLHHEMLATALSAVRSGQLSISEVAQSFGMGRKTLHKQLVAFPRLPLKRGPKTLLTEEEERTVVDYIHSFTGRGTRPRRDEIIRYASAILQQKSGVPPVPVSDGNGVSSEEPTTSDAKTKVGIKWWKKFRARHPELRDMRGNIPRERPVIKLVNPLSNQLANPLVNPSTETLY